MSHDFNGTLEIQAIHHHNGFHVVAGTGPDQSTYVRTYDVQATPPKRLSTVKHGNAYAYVRDLGGFDATGVA